jgi:tetratricopeptide (TPR) repeat protein
MDCMMRAVPVALLLCALCWSQQDAPKKPLPPKNPPPPRSEPAPENEGEYSSSRDNIIDLSPPKNDAKEHPDSREAVEETTGEVQEFHPYDPHRAEKNIEVGDFYLKRKNYRAAEDRYREALLYKPNDAIATFRLAQCLEKKGELQEARETYAAYLKILPNGPFAVESRAAIDRLKEKSADANPAGKGPPRK